jgi:BASS family bile acid:Na+ symporter
MFGSILAQLANAFPLWVLLASGLALVYPEWFTWFHPYIEPGLAVVMLGMGMTLSTQDFKAALAMPRLICLGFVAQYTLMPLTGWAIGVGFGLPRDFAVGIILVACCPGGTASNVVTYLARANVPLSVLMTMTSTLGAVVMTPLLTRLLAGALVEVNVSGMLWTTAKVVVLPIVFGLFLHHRAPRLVQAVMPVGPLVSVLMIALLCGDIIGLNASRVREHGFHLLGALVVLHAAGFTTGYLFARLFRYAERERRTVSVEVGMQNSALGTALANRHFSDPISQVALAAVPCAISAVVHSVIGSLVAGVWRLLPVKSQSSLINSEVDTAE